MPDQDGGLDQRDKMEDEAESNRRLHDLAQDIALLAKQEQRVEQSHAVESHRDSKPD